MPEIDLELLERALDEERGVAVGDRAQAGRGETGGDPDQKLLADADVDHAVGVPARCAGETRDGDVGEHEGDPLVVVEQLLGDGHESFAHCRARGARARSRSSLDVSDDEARPSLLACAERLLERLVVAAVDGRRGPALDGEARADPARPAV